MRHNDIDLQTACEASGHSLGLAVYCKPHPPHPSISGIYRGAAHILNALMRRSSLAFWARLPLLWWTRCPSAQQGEDRLHSTL